MRGRNCNVLLYLIVLNIIALQGIVDYHIINITGTNNSYEMVRYDIIKGSSNLWYHMRDFTILSATFVWRFLYGVFVLSCFQFSIGFGLCEREDINCRETYSENMILVALLMSLNVEKKSTNSLRTLRFCGLLFDLNMGHRGFFYP